jgi:hypothetical protein
VSEHSRSAIRSNARRARATLALAGAMVLLTGAAAPGEAGALVSPPCANAFMLSDLRCGFYSQLDASDQAAVAATAADLDSTPSLPMPPDEESGGPVPLDLPLDIPQPLPVTGISDDTAAPESPQVFLAENNYTGYLPDGTEARVWAGASAIDPSIGEVFVLIMTSDSNSVLSTKLLTAPSRDGTLRVTSTIDSGTLLLTASDNKLFRYPINGDHMFATP